MPWLLLALGAFLVWMSWDALRLLGEIRPLSNREIDHAVMGPGNKRLSEWGRIRARNWLSAHNSLELALAWLFLISGLACIALGLGELWIA